MKIKISVIVATIVVFFTTTFQVAAQTQGYGIVDTSITQNSIKIDWKVFGYSDSTFVYGDIYDSSTGAFISSSRMEVLHTGQGLIYTEFNHGLQPETIYRIVLMIQSTETKDTIMLDIATASSLVATATFIPVQCYGSSTIVSVSASGGFPPYIGTGVFSGLPGVYSFTVVDSRGYTASSSVTIAQPQELVVVATIISPISVYGGSATVSIVALGGTLPYYGTGIVSKPAGVYQLYVSDAHGCIATANVMITQPAQTENNTQNPKTK